MIPALQFLALMVAIMDSVLICLSKRLLVSGHYTLNDVDMQFCQLLIIASYINTNNFKAHTHRNTTIKNTQLNIQPMQHIKILHMAMRQTCRCLAPFPCPSRSHIVLTLVSGSCTQLESQHLSRDELTLLSDTL